MTLYLLKCTIAMGVSWCIFRLLLATQKNFTFNRIYLLIAIIGSTLAPLITLPTIFKEISLNTAIPFISEFDYSNTVVESQNSAIVESINLSGLFQWITIAISIMLAFRFVYRMIRIMQLSKGSFSHYKDGIRIAIIDDKRTPFSLFNVMYINKDGHEEEIKDAIFLHEKYHIMAWHSLDRIVVELLLILHWMNPFIYMLKRDLIDNHEYAADAYAIGRSDNKHAYLSLILKTVMPNPSKNFLLQQFSHSSSKKRIKMITAIQKKRQDWAYPIALVVLLVCFVSCLDDYEEDKIENSISIMDIANDGSPQTGGAYLNKMVKGEIPFPPPPAPGINRPTKNLLQRWSEHEMFEIWVDKTQVNNNILKNKSEDEFSLFVVREIAEKDKRFDSFEYRVDLMTNKAYGKFNNQQEKLRVKYKEQYPELWSEMDLFHKRKNLKNSNFF